ncbi:MAG: succinate dehydrogenase, cytochrome b556 subunit [Alphaproteobacteria bacterium]|nr:succinate dehydrogenase, cytochrome b556 subunit [Alphaproteobacteria bacterium]
MASSGGSGSGGTGAGTRARPMAPHLQVWRWHVTMAGSIFHRGTGVALYGAAIGLAVWLCALAAGPDVYAVVDGLLRTLPGELALYALSVAIAYHFANGIRHLVWDSGRGYKPSTADATGWLVIFFALVAPIGVWALARF